MTPLRTACERPLLPITGVVEIAPEEPEIRANRGGIVEQALRRGRIAADRRAAGPKDVSFLKPDLLAGGAQPIGMIDIHTRDDRAIRIDDVDGIEPATQTDFEHQDIKPGLREKTQDRQRRKLEIRQRDALAGGLDGFELCHQTRIVDDFPVDAGALVEDHQVGRGVEPDPIAGRQQDRLEHCAGRSLAVRAADDDAHCRGMQIQSRGNLSHAIQAHIDRARVQRFEVNKPAIERGAWGRLRGRHDGDRASNET